MANHARLETSNLNQTIHEYDFFQLVRLLQYSFGEEKTIIFKTLPSLTHPISDVVQLSEESDTIILWVTFMGLLGQAGVLPEHYMELILQKNSEKDTSLYHFINLFAHRLINLFYDAWYQARFFVDLDYQRENAIIGLIDNLTGINTDRLNNKLHTMVRHYAGLFSQKRRSKQGLLTLIKDYFNLPVTLNNYYMQPIPIVPQACCQLGVDAILGSKIWYAQNQFCLNIDSINYDEFMNLLPGQARLTVLKQVVNLYLSNEYIFTILISVKDATIPITQLNPKQSYRLGWNTWLKSQEKTKVDQSVKIH